MNVVILRGKRVAKDAYCFDAANVATINSRERCRRSRIVVVVEGSIVDVRKERRIFVLRHGTLTREGSVLPGAVLATRLRWATAGLAVLRAPTGLRVG